MMLYNMADMYFVGWLDDYAQVAAVSLAGPMFSVLMGVSTMIGNGGCTKIAQALGAGDMERVRCCSALCVWASVVSGAVFAAVCAIFCDPLLRLLGANAEMWDYTKSYVLIMALGAPVVLLNHSLGSALRGEGEVAAGLVGGMVSTVSNLILDPIDNAAAAVGTGAVGTGGCNISLGTSGTIFISSDKFGVDPNNALHAFAHADGGWHLMGCMLSAASCNQWWCGDILGTKDYPAEQKVIAEDKLGRNPVFFLPYLMGGRSPINDTDARGAFVGMGMDTARADLTQAVLEGVAFAIRDSFEVAKRLGVSIPRSTLCGGGSKSPLWRRILANVLGVPLDLPQTEQGPGYGGAMLAMVGCGAFESVQAACDALVRVAGTVEPDRELTARYDAQFRKFKTIYPTLKNVFPILK